MSNFKVGSDIVSYCGRCKLGLAHTIMSNRADGSIHKVECNTCKAVHGYRDPAAVKKRKTTRKSSKKATEVSLAEAWQKAVDSSSGTPEKYSIRGDYKVGELVSHPKFGVGLVHSVIDNTKVEILFKSVLKNLVMNK